MQTTTRASGGMWAGPKIVELAVSDVVHGRQVKNIEALANPEALGHFTDLEDLRH